jgi:hypothetical protein
MSCVGEHQCEGNEACSQASDEKADPDGLARPMIAAGIKGPVVTLSEFELIAMSAGV